MYRRTRTLALAGIIGPSWFTVAFAPAAKMEAFFREITQANAMPPQDLALWRAYGMELVGPPMLL
jgi:hypothetical protein